MACTLVFMLSTFLRPRVRFPAGIFSIFSLLAIYKKLPIGHVSMSQSYLIANSLRFYDASRMSRLVRTTRVGKEMRILKKGPFKNEVNEDLGGSTV